MATAAPVPVPTLDPTRAHLLGFFRWLEGHTDIMDPVMVELEPGPLTGQGLVELVDAYLAVAEPLMTCLGCGHHAADHSWSPPSTCLKAGCECESVR